MTPPTPKISNILVYGVVLALAGAVVSVVLFVGVSGVDVSTRSGQPIFAVPHVYGDATRSLEQISVSVVYFVPRDQEAVPRDVWHAQITTALTRLEDFHALQFHDRSRLTFSLREELVRGARGADEYRIDPSEHNDPKALHPILTELEALDIMEDDANGATHHVTLVLFEGDGAGGVIGNMFISRRFFERADTEHVADTFLAHEFYHALGVPDGYQTALRVFPDGTETAHDVISSSDIMGRVRIPLTQTYLSPETLRIMGL